MLREAAGVDRIILRTGKTDLRFGMDRLSSMVQNEFGFDPLETGTLFLFCGGRSDRIKGLLFEGDGYLLLTKRLTNGSFIWPRSKVEARELSRGSFERLMDGLEVTSSLKVYQKRGSGMIEDSGACDAANIDSRDAGMAGMSDGIPDDEESVTQNGIENSRKEEKEVSVR